MISTIAAASELQLFAHPFSSYCQKVLIALWVDETPFEYRLLDDEHPENIEELERHWPFRLFPLLLDLGKPVVETSCIIEHLQARKPGGNEWIPDGETGRHVRFLDRFFDLHVMNNRTVPVFNAIRPEGKKDPYGVEQAMARLRTAYDWLETNLGEGPWAAGRALHPRRLRCSARAFLRGLGPGNRPIPPPAGGLSRKTARPSRRRPGRRRGPPLSPFFPARCPGSRLIP